MQYCQEGGLLGIDADPIELPKTELRLRALCASNEELVLRRMNYAGAAQFVADETSDGCRWAFGRPRDLLHAIRQS